MLHREFSLAVGFLYATRKTLLFLLLSQNWKALGLYRLVYGTTQLVQYDESKTIRLDAVHLTKVFKKRTPLLLVFLISPFADRGVFIDTHGIDAIIRSPLLLMIVVAIWFGIPNAVREIVKEAAIYRREWAMHLKIGPYVLSKVLVLGTLCLIQVWCWWQLLAGRGLSIERHHLASIS